MPVDLERTRSRAKHEQEIANCSRADNPGLYGTLCYNLVVRKMFDAGRSLEVIIIAAKKGECLSCRSIADVNALDWSKVHYSVGGHLDELTEAMFDDQRILIGSVITNKSDATSYRMEQDIMRGFIRTVRGLGIEVQSDYHAFVTVQQNKVFEWARTRDKS